MELKLKNKFNESQIGIASSIACQFNFNWQKTLHFAKELNVSIIQLFLPPIALLKQYVNEIESEADNISELYFHLPKPKQAEEISDYYKQLKLRKSVDLIIQHEKFLDGKTLNYIEENKLPFGLENDQTNNINSYLERLDELKNINIDLTAVIDVSRFYLQYHERFSAKEIYNEIIKILDYCDKQSIPVVFHVIDHVDYEAERNSWTALFSGIIPWKNIFNYAFEHNIFVKSIIFEYEDFHKTKVSVDLLRNWGRIGVLEWWKRPQRFS